MSLRRFLNLVTMNRKDGVYSLRRIDLSRQPLFYPTPPPAADDKKSLLDLQEMERIRIPAASVRFRPNPSYDSIDHKWKFHCFGLSDDRIICTDNSGLAFLYDAVSRSVVTMPSLHSRKWCPISFSVLGPDEDGGPEDDGPGSCLYIMEKFMEQVTNAYSDQGQFEGFIHTSSETSFRKSWYRLSLPPPPYVLDPGYQHAQIYSQAVLGGGSHLCISALGHGTYCFDTASREWSHAGDWMLPIKGMAEYVPELDLWFGLSERDLLPCASDFSSVLEGQKPTLSDIWRIHYPPSWDSYGITNIISLGGSRFCIVKFFETMQEGTYCFGQPVVDDIFAVFTGVELMSSRTKTDKVNGRSKETRNDNGKRRIRMVKHMSKVHVLSGYTTIEAVL